MNPQWQRTLESFQSGQYEKALHMCNAILAASPQNAPAYHLAGIICLQSNDSNNAVKYLKNAASLAHEDSEVFYHAGLAHQLTNDAEPALHYYSQALKLNPKHAEAHDNKGIILQTQRKFEQALHAHTLAIDAKPELINPYIHAAEACRKLHRYADAEAFISKALELDPEHYHASYTLATLLNDCRRFEEAIPLFWNLTLKRKDDAKVWRNLGVSFFSIPHAQYRDAEKCFRRAIELNPNYAEAHISLANLLLFEGRLDEGWQEYQWRFRSEAKKEEIGVFHNEFGDHQNFKDQRVLVLPEQGLGEELLFSSCFPDLIEDAKETYIICDHRLKPLYERTFPQAVIQGANKRCEIDINNVQVDSLLYSGSLLKTYRNNLACFNKRTFKLITDEQKNQYWKNYLSNLNDNLKIGISWTSQIRNASRNHLYSELDDLLSWFKIPGLTFVSLQYGDHNDAIEYFSKEHGVRIAVPEIDLYNDLDNIASLCNALDLVISPSNYTYILAAAVGTPVWMTSSGIFFSFGQDNFPWLSNVTSFPRHPYEPDTRLSRQRLGNALFKFSQHQGHYVPTPQDRMLKSSLF